MGLTNPGETRRLMGTGPAVARQESACQDFGRLWNPTDPYLPFKPGHLADYQDPLLTLHGVETISVFVFTIRLPIRLL